MPPEIYDMQDVIDQASDSQSMSTVSLGRQGAIKKMLSRTSSDVQEMQEYSGDVFAYGIIMWEILTGGKSTTCEIHAASDTALRLQYQNEKNVLFFLLAF